MTRPIPFLTLLVSLACATPLRAAETADKIDAQMQQATLVAKGQAAPDFASASTDGRQFALSAQKGKVVVLYFFDARIGACVTEMKLLEKEVFQKLRDRGDFALVGIGRGHSRDELVTVGGANGLTFPLMADPQAEVFRRYFSKFVPRTVVVRRDGTISHLASGYRDLTGIIALQQALDAEFRGSR